jgi:hypothetical protein
MRSRWIWLAGLIVLTILAFEVNHKRAQKRRDEGYESIRNKYSNDLTPGIKREAVEIYLKQNGLTFRHLNPGRPGATNYDDMVLIAREKPNFACAEQNVYLDIRFNDAAQVKPNDKVNPLDTLRSISVHRMFEGCL